MRDTDRRPRRVIVVDLENLLGCAPGIASDACWALALSRTLAAVRFDAEADHLVLGVGPDWVFTARDLAPFARIVSLRGRDGADRALCAELEDVAHLRSRFDGVVVASGDHAFVQPVARLRHAGMPVTLAALPVQVSAELAAQTPDIVWLARPALTLGAAAYVSSAEGMRRVATVARDSVRVLALAA